jgi:hypothetical protein
MAVLCGVAVSSLSVNNHYSNPSPATVLVLAVLAVMVIVVLVVVVDALGMHQVVCHPSSWWQIMI